MPRAFSCRAFCVGTYADVARLQVCASFCNIFFFSFIAAFVVFILRVQTVLMLSVAFNRPASNVTQTSAGITLCYAARADGLSRRTTYQTGIESRYCFMSSLPALSAAWNWSIVRALKNGPWRPVTSARSNGLSWSWSLNFTDIVWYAAFDFGRFSASRRFNANRSIDRSSVSKSIS